MGLMGPRSRIGPITPPGTTPLMSAAFLEVSDVRKSYGPTVALNGVQGAGTVIGNLYKDHLEVQYSTSIGAITCGGCTPVAAVTPATPPNALQLFSGTVTAGGQFSGINWNTLVAQTPQQPTPNQRSRSSASGIPLPTSTMQAVTITES